MAHSDDGGTDAAVEVEAEREDGGSMSAPTRGRGPRRSGPVREAVLTCVPSVPRAESPRRLLGPDQHPGR
ncbi:hypothetical protein K1Y78_33920 [Streptomyces sp. tea 10]|nr:hypothetical protein [Streptomyces sp. tea 10]